MRPKLDLKDKHQMSTPNENTDNFKSNLTCIFLCQGQIKKKHSALGHCVVIIEYLHSNNLKKRVPLQYEQTAKRLWC